MSILEIIELIVIAVIVLFLLIYYGIKAIKNHWVDELVMTINDAIKFIEKQSMKGYEKKQYVLQRVQDKCSELNIPYVFIEKLVSRLIDRIVKDHNVFVK